MIEFLALHQYVYKRSPVPTTSIHGPTHWQRVERNGLYLAQTSGADETVIRLFALFHDCMRQNDWIDPGHGRRGADCACQLRGDVFDLDDARFDLLIEACQGHTDLTHHDNPTIGACWDADRLDLGRCGIRPKAKFLNTEEAKRIAATDDFVALERFKVDLSL